MPQKPAGIQLLGQEYVIRELEEQFLSQAAHNHLPPPQGTPLSPPSAGSSVQELLSLGKELGKRDWGLRNAPTQRGARSTAPTPPAHSQTLLFPSLSPDLASLPESRFVFCQPLGVTGWEHFEEFLIKGFL